MMTNEGEDLALMMRCADSKWLYFTARDGQKYIKMSTAAHLTKYTAMKCTYICRALRRWLVMSQMEHLR